MVVEIDHYIVLGLPSGEEGAKLSDHEIHKAFKTKALQLHPDKRRDDPNAHANFLKLQSSYEVLKDVKARKLFDDLLRIEWEKVRIQRQRDLKRRRMMSDLEEDEERYYRQRDLKRSDLSREEEEEEEERYYFGVDLTREEEERYYFGIDLTRDEEERYCFGVDLSREERYSRKLDKEFARIIALYLKRKRQAAAAAAAAATRSSSKQDATDHSRGSNAAAATQSSSSKQGATDHSGGNDGLETAMVLIVSWEKTIVVEDYTAQRLDKIFGKFGCVEEVFMRRKKGSAFVIMASKDDAVFVTGMNWLGDASNPLLVELLQPDCQNSVVEKMRKFLG